MLHRTRVIPAPGLPRVLLRQSALIGAVRKAGAMNRTLFEARRACARCGVDSPTDRHGCSIHGGRLQWLGVHFSIQAGVASRRGPTQVSDSMADQCQSSARIPPAWRVAFLGIAVLTIYMAMSLDIRHPIQTTMDVLAPIPFLLLAATHSYRSQTAKLALAASLFLIAVMIAQPSLHSKPWFLY